MITAIDTNVLIDVFAADPNHGRSSRDALTRCLQEGSVILSEIVLAETAAGFESQDVAEQSLDLIGAVHVATTRAAALRAGRAWRAYRAAGGPRDRIMADFVIGAHALEHADRLLTRDRGFYRRYFQDLAILDPAGSGAT